MGIAPAASVWDRGHQAKRAGHVRNPGAKDPIDALRCTGCGRLWVSGSARRMIRRNEGCLACGEPVEQVLVDDRGVHPIPARPIQSGRGG